jgi:hypothetical protein
MSFRFNALRAAAGAAVLSMQALAWATPSFVNGLMLDGAALDLSGGSNANIARLGYFSDIYFDPNRNEWWGLSDRGPGGGVIDYATRVQRFTLDIDAATGAISNFKVAQTVKFTTAAGEAFNGLNPLLLSGNAGTLGRSFDPEGFVVNPKNGNFYVSDEYGPSLYEFDRNGVFLRAFATPANLVPRVGATVDYVATRDAGLSLGRQDNRGFEGLAVSPDGNKLYAVLQDPLFDDVASRNGRNGRNVRIVEFDAASGASTRQLAYQLEAQADIAARITAAGGTATPTDPRQGRNVGLSAIVALNGSEFLVLERDNRGLGVDDPAGANVVGSKRVYKIDLSGASDVSAAGPLGAEALPAGVVPVAKSATFIDLAADTVMPNGKQAEKWEGLAIGPQLADGSHLLLAGTDNDYSVTQTAAAEQFDVYVDFAGNSVQCPLDVACAPKGYQLIPAVLHAYKAGTADLSGYLQPVPEPQTYALMGGGLALVTAWARRRRTREAG